MAVVDRLVPRPYSVSVSLELFLAVALPLGAVLVSNVRWVPTAIFLLAAIPALIALALHRFLPAPRSIVLGGAFVFLAGTVLSTAVNTPMDVATLADMVLRALLILCFIYVAALVPLLEPRDGSLIVLAVILACAASVAVNAAYYIAGDPALVVPGEARFKPIFGTPGRQWPTEVSATYAVLFAGAVAMLVSSRNRTLVRVLAGAAAVVIATGLILTQARSGYIGGMAGAACVLLFVNRRMRRWIFGVAATAVVIVLLSPLRDLLLARGLSHRTGIWVDYAGWWLESPVLGYGMHANVHRMVEGMTFFHAHNLILSSAVRSGILGLASMIAMLAGGIYFAWRYAVHFRCPMFLSMIVALFVAALFDYDVYLVWADWSWLTIWFPIALGAGTELAMRRRQGEVDVAASTARAAGAEA